MLLLSKNLKPRKKITRKEIKTDPVLESVANTYSFIQDKQKILVQIGIGIAIGFILFNIWALDFYLLMHLKLNL